MNAIEVERLSRSFNGLNAVDDISFSVQEAEIFGFLGHNGARCVRLFGIDWDCSTAHEEGIRPRPNGRVARLVHL